MALNRRHRHRCLAGTSSLWTAVAFMATIGAVVDDLRILILASIVANVAALSTAWLLLNSALRRERLRLESLAQIMANAAAQQSEVTRIRK